MVQPPSLTPTPALTAWLNKALDDGGPFTLTRLAGGNSNETMRLNSPQGRRILRRPPRSAIGPTAHSMEREFRVLTAMAQTPVAAPRPLALCTDPDVAPSHVLVMEMIEGDSLTDRLPTSYTSASDAMQKIGEAVIDELAALHSVDWKSVGLVGFGRPDGFLERQVPRWSSQYAKTRTRDIPEFDSVATWLEVNRPRTFDAGILHSDFHLDNCLLLPEPSIRVAAIIDWEMATIGDPLLDVGLFLALWGPERPAEPGLPLLQAVTRVPEAPTRHELAHRYADATGRDVSEISYYMALGLWKLATIIEGAYGRYLEGTLASAYARGLEHDVPRLFHEAAIAAGIADH